jgi:hypothetical protein
MKLSWSHDLDREFDKLTRVDSDRSNMFLFQYYFFKKNIVLIFFKLNNVFTDYL